MSEEEDGNEEETEEGDKLAAFGSRLMRGPRGDVFQRLVSQYLILSISASPLQSILYTCRAAFMVSPDKRKELLINEEHLEVIYVVARNLQSALQTKTEEEGKIDLYWGFKNDQENFKKYVAPWLQQFWFVRPSTWHHYPEKRKAFESLNHFEQFFWASANQYPASLQNLINSFLMWAIPQTQRISEAVSQLVNPLTYNEILQLFGKQQKQGGGPEH